MNIFTDLHHGDLYYALYLLFEKRLGFKLYRPIGLDWFYEGYWKIAEPYNNAIDTVSQYLDETHIPWHTSEDNFKNYTEDGVYYIYEEYHKYFQRAISLEKFKSMKFDLIVPSFSMHDYTFEKLANEYMKSAKLISHMGNVAQTTHLKNVIHAVPYNNVESKNSIYMHQEIDTNIYKSTIPNNNTQNITSVVNLAPYLDIYNEYKDILYDCIMKYYGIGSPDGRLHGTLNVAKKMQESNLGWSCKPLGGLGHSNMGWFYSKRAVITNMSQHTIYGGNALDYFEPNVTCIDIESGTINENCKKIKKWLEPENNIKYCENAKRRFHDIINYDVEEENFKTFLSNIL